MRATAFLLLLASFAYGQDNFSQDDYGQDDKPAADQYYPAEWGWSDPDGDCLDTRADVLKRRSHQEVVVNNCVVRSGKWTDAYTGLSYTQAEDVVIDHVVPLRHAHDSGAAEWPSMLRRVFANDLDNLLITTVEASAQKGGREPQYWTPPNSEITCEYLEKWQAIKYKYRLEQSQEELQFLESHQCYQKGGVALSPENDGVTLAPRSEVECAEVSYKVIKGDTFYSLSRRFSVSVESLQDLVGSDILSEHQVLTIREDSGACL